jgi:PAS domain S-box-containing protein
MRAPEKPDNEVQRLAALRQLAILDTAPEERYDRITRTAKQVFDVPIAGVSLVDENRQWFKSRQGLDAFETPREISFCGHAILGDGAFVVEDTLADPRFRDNPLVKGNPHIRFYAGVPLSTMDGFKLGTLCIIDRKPRSFDQHDRAFLTGLAQWVERELTFAAALLQVALRLESKVFLPTVLDNVIEAVISADADGHIESVNRAAERMFGYSREELMRMRFRALLLERDREKHDSYLKHLQTAVLPFNRSAVESVGLRKDGTEFPIEVSFSMFALGGARVLTGNVRDITERRRAEDALRKSEERLALALEGSNLALFDWDLLTGTVQLSKEWSVILGDSPHATTTNIRDLERLVHPNDTARLQDELRAALTGNKPFYAIEHRVRNHRGNWIWILSRAKVTAREVTGRALRVTGTNTNITQRKEIERMKDDFIGTVNHELRTPLTAVVGSLALLKEGLAGLPPDQAMMLDMACQSSARLQSLVNDILDLDKIASGAMRFDLAPVALGPFLRRALEINRLYADRFKVRYELPGPLPRISLTADSERLMQAITNLLSNAAKFSPEGEAIIIAATIAGDRARVTVTDHGAGVPVEFHDRIFGKFTQADSSNTRGQDGSGLGLYICKAIIENMGGRIGFESVPGQGATFYFELPYTEDSSSLSDLN